MLRSKHTEVRQAGVNEWYSVRFLDGMDGWMNGCISCFGLVIGLLVGFILRSRLHKGEMTI